MQHVDHQVLQRKILEKRTVTQTGRKCKGSLRVNEINKTTPNRKRRGFVERSLSFLNCGEKSFSSLFHYLVAAVTGSSIVDFCLKKERNCGYFCFLSKSNAVFGVNEINKIAPNRKQRGFVERSLPFPNCGEKSFSSSFRYLVAAVAESSTVDLCLKNKGKWER